MFLYNCLKCTYATPSFSRVSPFFFFHDFILISGRHNHPRLPYILTISTLALENTLWAYMPSIPSSPSSIDKGLNDILAYVPAPRRLERVPGLMTSTLSMI